MTVDLKNPPAGDGGWWFISRSETTKGRHSVDGYLVFAKTAFAAVAKLGWNLGWPSVKVHGHFETYRAALSYVHTEGSWDPVPTDNFYSFGVDGIVELI